MNRREFIKGATATAAAIGLAPVVPTPQQAADNMAAGVPMGDPVFLEPNLSPLMRFVERLPNPHPPAAFSWYHDDLELIATTDP